MSERLKLGLMVNNLGPNQLAYSACRNFNTLQDTNVDGVLFFVEKQRRCMPTNFAVMQLFEAYEFTGSLIATDINTAGKLIRFPSTDKKFFYVWDLEWIRMGNQKSYEQLRSIYGNPELKLLARSALHAKAISDVWDKPCEVVEDCNVKELIRICI